MAFLEIPVIRTAARIELPSTKAAITCLAVLGPVCEKFQDKAMRNLPCKRVQCDEIW